jgi:hypothetical protein
MSEKECAPGWHYCADIQTAWQIAGMWPAGRPGLVVRVEASRDAIARGTKRRASQLTLRRLASPEEISAAVQTLSTIFGTLAAEMTAEQLAWYAALARPHATPHLVEAGLAAALEARELPWALKRFSTATLARDAWDAWDARDALLVYYTVRRGWGPRRADRLTIGLRDAYSNGLGLALPTGPNELGWALAEGEDNA